MLDNFLSLLGGALGEPVVAQQHCDLVGVNEFPGHEGQRAKWHLLKVQRMVRNSRTKGEVGHIKTGGRDSVRK